MCKEGDLHMQITLSDIVILFWFCMQINVTTELGNSLPVPEGL